ncbi:unnamed protein product [Gongylonema pulchrum]|uniref:SP-RING-type domain-containing protein n=1 Tax=Gongylonema pulchrum TaxID=637853 RepID=A0A183DV28_9BILA|nr:unnamed protein product [Gongylonema pulchrum]
MLDRGEMKSILTSTTRQPCPSRGCEVRRRAMIQKLQEMNRAKMFKSFIGNLDFQDDLISTLRNALQELYKVVRTTSSVVASRFPDSEVTSAIKMY